MSLAILTRFNSPLKFFEENDIHKIILQANLLGYNYKKLANLFLKLDTLEATDPLNVKLFEYTNNIEKNLAISYVNLKMKYRDIKDPNLIHGYSFLFRIPGHIRILSKDELTLESFLKSITLNEIQLTSLVYNELSLETIEFKKKEG